MGSPFPVRRSAVLAALPAVAKHQSAPREGLRWIDRPVAKALSKGGQPEKDP